MKHPHYEVMMEWAADTSKVVQYQNPSGGKWVDEMDPPDFSGSGKYRIKPEKKPDVSFDLIVHQVAAYPEIRYPEHWEMANIKFTFSGETGKLIKAEVL